MSVFHSVPIDFWGFTIDEIKAIFKKDRNLHARITKESFSYDTLKGFGIKDVGEYKIVAPNFKKLSLAVQLVLEEKRKRDNPQKYKSIFERK